MQVDIVGRIKNLQLPATQPLIPLFECLVNSIEAIEDRGGTGGRIDVYFDRDTSQVSAPGIEESSVLQRTWRTSQAHGESRSTSRLEQGTVQL